MFVLGAACAYAAVPKKPDTYAYAYDFDADVLGQSAIQEISLYGAALEEATGIQVIAVAVDFLDGMDAADYATDLINTWGIGSKDERERMDDYAGIYGRVRQELRASFERSIQENQRIPQEIVTYAFLKNHMR